MATQTGSIDLTTSNAVKLAAEAGWQSDLNRYYTKSEIDLTVDGIESDVTEIVDGLTQSSHFTQTADGFSFTLDDALEDAEKVATNYFTNITGGGVMVHPSDDATTGVQITSDVDIMRDGTSVINIGTNDAVRIGVDDNAHVKMLLEPNAMAIENESGSEIFSVDSGSTGTLTVALTASLVTWDTTASVDTTAHSVSDAGTASGTATVTATINGTDYTLDSTYATATVTAGTGVAVALTSDGVTYVRDLMVETVEDEGGTVTTTYPCELSVEYQHAVTDIALLSLIGSQTIDGEGNVLYLVNDRWQANTRQTGALLGIRNSTTGREIKLGVSYNGYTRGLYDSYKNDWVIARNKDNKTVINGPNFSVNSAGFVSAGPTVVAKGINRVALYSSATSGDMGLRDITNNKWIIYRHHNYGIVLGNSVNDSLYHRTSTVTTNTTNVTQSGDNHCWNNGAVCSFVYRCAVKSALANGSELAVGTLPANYRPPYDIAVEVYTSAAVCVTAKVGTNGTITVMNVSGSSLATSVLLRISGTWAC